MQTEPNMDSYTMEASDTGPASHSSTMDEISVAETEFQIPKTGPGTMAEPQQPASEPSVESMQVLDKWNPRDCAEIDDAFVESFQNLHIGRPVTVKVSCVNWFCLCLKERSSSSCSRQNCCISVVCTHGAHGYEAGYESTEVTEKEYKPMEVMEHICSEKVSCVTWFSVCQDKAEDFCTCCISLPD